MNLESTIETAAGYLPSDIDLSGILKNAAAYIPAEVDFISTAKFLVFFAAVSMIMGTLGRVVMGKRSNLNHSLSSTMGILFIYVITIAVYTFKPSDLIQALSPLPFVTFVEDIIVISPVIGTSFSILCSQALSLIILAFLVNILDSLIPKGGSVLSWYLCRFLTITLAMVLHWIVHWAFSAYLPGPLVTFAPIALVCILISMLLLGVFNVVLGAVLAVIDPIMGGIYTFFFSNFLGKQITKAVFSSLLICCLLIALDKLGYTVICITASALLSYIPIVLVLLLLWYLLGHVL